MSLDKAIQHNKEHRKKYYGAKSIDPTCRNHGGCPTCLSNRMHKNRIKDERDKVKLNDFNANI